MSTMAWYPLPHQSGGGTPSLPGGEFLFDDQNTTGWPLWCFGSSPDDDGPDDSHCAGGAPAEKHGNDDDAAGSSDEHAEGEGRLPVTPPPQQRAQPTDDIFMSQFSDEEMRRMDDAPFEALDMFPGSMHRLLSYENMLSGVLTGSSSEDQDQQQDATLGVDTMDTCGFPLFSHDLMHDGSTNTPATELVPEPDLTPEDEAAAGASFRRTKRSRSSAIGEGSLFLEALVLQDLQDVVFKKLTKRTRVCFRDAFFRLAENSRAKCRTPSSDETETGVQQAAEGNASSRISTTTGPGCPERETNAIDRTVADLTMKPPRPVPLDDVLVSRCADADDSGAAEAQSATSSWTTTA